MTELLLKLAIWKKDGGARRILKEFPGRNWNLSSLSYQIKKIKDTGSTSRKQGSGRPRTAVNDDNKAYVEEMVVSQEDQPGTHKSQREISRDLNVSRTSIRRMTKELNLKPFKRVRVSRRDQKVKQKRKTPILVTQHRRTLNKVVPHFIKKDEWPQQSPDLNPMDYTIWDSLYEKVYKGRTQKFTENELKEKIWEKWEEITLEEVRKSIGSFKKRLRAVCEQNGGHIDRLLN